MNSDHEFYVAILALAFSIVAIVVSLISLWQRNDD